MRRIPESSRPARSGFTLVELLVVIGIIALLVSLTAAAVMRVRRKATELQMRSDISQLSSSVTQFNVEYSVDHFPSVIILKNDLTTYNLGNVVEKESLLFLKRVWPRLQSQIYTANLFPATDARYSLGWFPDDPAAALTSSYTLTGDECLVFFLGGIQKSGACIGFSANANNPTIYNTATASGTRKQLFDFPTSRLKAASNGPLVFLDPQGTMPYAYFSNYGIDNGYNRYAAVLGASDCPSLVANGAYKDANGTYYNKSSFQIICAGTDKEFGQAPNGIWDSKSGLPFAAGASDPGYDDLSNFHDRIMGAGTQ